MCGFLGEIGKLSGKNAFLALLDRSRKRGPDDQQIVQPRGLVRFGFNRLAILDLSEAGRQPMYSQDGQWLVMFNGEVYNHLDLRKRLRGTVWRGHSDAETLTEAIARWGFEATLFEIDGMFAIAAWHLTEKKLYLARDFAGIKPLFFGWNEETFVFASQYDQVVAHPACHTHTIDPSVLHLYLEQHFMPAPFGIYQNTGQLEPGEWMVVDKNLRQQKVRYWDFPEWVEPNIFEEKKAMEWVETALQQAVDAELLSDVLLGTFLSGGIDSPLVTYFANRHSSEPLKAFSIGSDSTDHDESALASRYAELIGVQHRLERMDSHTALSWWEGAMESLHEPLGDFSLLPTFLVSHLAAREITVALSGDGGDELFFGYERFWSVLKNPLWHRLPRAIKYGIYGTDRLLSRNRNINGTLLAPYPGRAHRGLHSRFSESRLKVVAPELAEIKVPESYATYSYHGKNKDQVLQHMRRAEFYGMMQKTLRKVDLASMENSLEIRVPFLKKTFIEASLKVDPRLSFGPHKKKTLLKKILVTRLPGSPIDNIKRGFSIPLSNWLRRELREPFRDVLSQVQTLQDFGLSTKGIEQLFRQHEQGKDAKWPLFTLYALVKWKESLNALNLNCREDKKSRSTIKQI